MTALSLLQRLHELGVGLTPLPDGTVRYKAPKGVLTPYLLDALRQYKQELHTLVEDFEERAAIAEYDDGLARNDAERLAWACMQGIGDEGQTIQTAEGCMLTDHPKRSM